MIAGVFVGVATTWSLSGLWRRGNRGLGKTRSVASAAASTAIVGTVAVLLYLQLGRPELVAGVPITQADRQTTAEPHAMEEVTEKLAARLARDGGGETDWQLLAQSYQFMGRTNDAARAREQVAAITQNDVAANSALEQAQALRVQGKLTEARTAYEAAIERNGMTADGWADYADLVASQTQNKLAGAPAQAIEKALALNPDHRKALWLKATLAHEEHRYADAVPLWRHLREVMGETASDARVIEANLAEAQRLAATAEPMRAVVVAVTGSIDVDTKLIARITQGSILFIYAKSVDSPGPPLAVLRVAIAKWPVQFKLDDSMAMTPGRNLSSATNVIVAARISKTGQATAMTGDLQTTGVRANPRDRKALRLLIDKEVN